MDTDRNLLFGVLALQVDLIDAKQFAEACAHWTAKKEVPLSEILIELGWISETDRREVDRFVERRIRKHRGDVHASLVSSADDTVNRTLAQIEDDDVEDSLVQASDVPLPNLVTTINLSPEVDERYQLAGIHARGGLGRVWLARDNQLGRNVALKDIRPQKAEDPATMTRFLKEAQITGQQLRTGVAAQINRTEHFKRRVIGAAVDLCRKAPVRRALSRNTPVILAILLPIAIPLAVLEAIGEDDVVDRNGDLPNVERIRR